MSGLFDKIYKPDVLTCLSDLSNDEVFTPPQIANQMLDLLPKDIWKDPSVKILDPACKSGVFLREAAKRFIKGEADIYPNLQDRCNHIFKEQLYGIAITELTSLISRRSVYCSKYPNGHFSIVHFDNSSGNIRYVITKHTWDKNGKCVFCGASKEQLGEKQRQGLETHAYEFIHTVNPEDIFNMHFDVILGNPPYQMETGGGTEGKKSATQAKPIYNQFIDQAKKLNPRYITMIIPARWYNGGIGLKNFREEMLNDGHVVKLVDYVNSKDCFQGVDIAGGVCYFLWDREAKSKTCTITNISGDHRSSMDRPLNEFGNLFIRSNDSMTILKKVLSKQNEFMDRIVSPIDTFGIPSKEKGHSIKKDGDFVLITSSGYNNQSTAFISPSKVKKNINLVNKYKVKISIMVPQGGEVGIKPENGYRSISTPQILKPGEVDSFSYLNVGFFDSEEEAKNLVDYLKCKFTRFLLRTTYSSVHVSKDNFIFVPLLDFHEHWNDAKLYKLFNLNNDEIELIEKTMRPMSNNEEGDEDA